MDPTQLQNMMMLQALQGQSPQAGMVPPSNPMGQQPLDQQQGGLSPGMMGMMPPQMGQGMSQPNPYSAMMNTPPGQ